MNLEEIGKLKRGDFVKDRETGAIFKVLRVEYYPEELNEAEYVSIPLSVELVHLPDDIHIRSGESSDEVFSKVGDYDWIYYDMVSFHNAEVGEVEERILTCQDFEKVEADYVFSEPVKVNKPEIVTSFKNEELNIEYSDKAKEAELAARAELAESLIFPVEQARANKEKFHTLKCELAQLSQLIKDASKLGKSSINIPSDLDRIEITALFLKAGYKVGNGSIAW